MGEHLREANNLLGVEQILDQKLLEVKFFGVNIFGRLQFLEGQTMLGEQKFWASKNVGGPKIWGVKNCLVSTNFGVEHLFGVTRFVWVKNLLGNLGPIFLRQLFFWVNIF